MSLGGQNIVKSYPLNLSWCLKLIPVQKIIQAELLLLLLPLTIVYGHLTPTDSESVYPTDLYLRY